MVEAHFHPFSHEVVIGEYVGLYVIIRYAFNFSFLAAEKFQA